MKRDQIAQIASTRIEAGLSFQDIHWRLDDNQSIYGIRNKPEYWMSLVKGDYWERTQQTNKNGDLNQRGSNQILPKLMAKHAILVAGETEFFVEPTAPWFAPQAKIASASLNTLWDRMGFDEPRNKAVWDAEIYGYGVCEVGWRFVRDAEELDGMRGEPLVAPDALQQLKDMAPPQTEQQFATEAEAAEAYDRERMQEARDVWQADIDAPYIERFSPEHLIVDPNCTSWDLSDAVYAFRIRYERLDRVKTNSKYKNTAGLTGGVYYWRDDSQGLASFKQAEMTDVTRDDQALVKLFDGYMWLDVNGDGKEEFVHIVMADEDRNNLLLFEDSRDETFPCKYYEWDTNPFPWIVRPGLVTDNDIFYPDSAVEQAAPLQIAYDKSWTITEGMKQRSGRVWMARRNALDEEAQMVWAQGADGTIMYVDGDVLENNFKPVENPQPPTELLLKLKDDIPEIGRQLAVNEFQESITPDKKMLATEINQLAAQGSGRTQLEDQQNKAFTAKLGMRILALLQQFGDTPWLYSDTTPMGEKQWGTADAIDLRGMQADGETPEPIGVQFKLKVNATQKNPANKESDRDQKLQALQFVMQMAQAGLPLDPKPVLAAVLDTFPEIDRDAVLNPQMPMMPGAMTGMPPQPGAMPQAQGVPQPQPTANPAV